MNEGGQEYRKALANRKAKIKRKSPLGSRTQSPDQQYATGMMGKQPIAVYPKMGSAPSAYDKRAGEAGVRPGGSSGGAKRANRPFEPIRL